MAFKAADWLLCLWLWLRNGVIGGIGRIEPYSAIAIKNPMAPTLRIAKFGLKCPAINSPVDELRWAVLSCRSHNLEARTQYPFLLPFSEVLRLQRRATHQVH